MAYYCAMMGPYLYKLINISYPRVAGRCLPILARKEGLDLIYCTYTASNKMDFFKYIPLRMKSRQQAAHSSCEGIVNQKEGQDIRPGLLLTRRRVRVTREKAKARGLV